MWDLLVKNTVNVHCVFVIASDTMQSASDLRFIFHLCHNTCFIMQIKILQSISRFHTEDICVYHNLLLKCKLSQFAYVILECLVLFCIKRNKLEDS